MFGTARPAGQRGPRGTGASGMGGAGGGRARAWPRRHRTGLGRVRPRRRLCADSERDRHGPRGTDGPLMQLLRRLTDGDGHPLTRRLRALWGGDRPRLRAVDGGHAATPWGESHVPGHYWGEWTAESLRAAQMV